MKLDVTLLRYLSRDDFRTLTAVEQGMKNHEIVPTQLIHAIAKLKHGGAKKSIGVLHKNKLVWHDAKKYDGYKLTYSGYDFLALNTFSSRDTIIGIGNKLGVGKESDLYIAVTPDGKDVALKLHRLGRVSFRTIKNNRDYLQHRKSASWLYLSRLSALKEFAFMKALHNHGFPTPVPIDVNRHCVLMSLVDGYLLASVKKLRHPGRVYNNLMNLIIRLAEYGLIHCDFNEFNIMIDDEEEITLIDFPQMISTSHANAEMYFNRDVECIKTFFSKKFGYEGAEWPRFDRDIAKEYSLDVEVAASGFTKKEQKEFNELMDQLEAEQSAKVDENGEEYNDEDDEEGAEESGEEDDEEAAEESDGSVDSSDDDEEGERGEVLEDSDGEVEHNTNRKYKSNRKVKDETRDFAEEGERIAVVDRLSRKLKSLSTDPDAAVDEKEGEVGEQQQGEEDDDDENSEDEEVDADYVKKRVRRNFKNRGNYRSKKNPHKLQARRDNSNAIKSAW